MRRTLANCIYCGKAVDCSKGEGDHVIPEAFGEFRGDVRFRRICRVCHATIDKSVEQLVRCGPESMLRDFVGLTSKRSRRRGKGRSKGAQGAPAPERTVDTGDHFQLVDRTTTPGDVEPVDHIVVRDKNGDDHRIRLFDGMRLEQLKERLATRVKVPIEDARLHCGDQDFSKYLDLMRGVWPNLKVQELPATEAGTHRVLGRVYFSVTERYFQAIAKIAFHYLLIHTRRGFSGTEPGFGYIREFIVNGGAVDQFFAPSPKPISPPLSLRKDTRWCHVLIANESANPICVQVQLFTSPSGTGTPYQVMLGQLDSAILVPAYVYGHRYLYDPPENRRGRYSGEVRDLPILRLPSDFWVPSTS